MEAEYKDFMSIEIEEGDVLILIKELSPNRNHLSSLSPISTDKCSSESLVINSIDSP